MGFFKFATSSITHVYETSEELIESLTPIFPDFNNRFSSIEPIKLDPERYLYLRNWSVSSEERHGPNENFDGFPGKELRERHLTFIGVRSTLDHLEDKKIGMVIASVFLEPQFNEKNGFIGGDYVQNILAIDKKMAEKFHPGIIELIETSKVTDTSMGCWTSFITCTISTCLKKATTEEEYCEHLKPENHLKGKWIQVGDHKEQIYESCHDVTFFEDAIIRPLNLRGEAGGAGADAKAKILEKVGSIDFKLGDYIVDRLKQIEMTCNKKCAVIDDKGDENRYSGAIDYMIQRMNEGTNFQDAYNETMESFSTEEEQIDIEEGNEVMLSALKKKGIIKEIIGDDIIIAIDDEEYIVNKKELSREGGQSKKNDRIY